MEIYNVCGTLDCQNFEIFKHLDKILAKLLVASTIYIKVLSNS